MKRQKTDVLYEEISRHNPVTMRVHPGEVFQVETILSTGSWLNSVEDVFSRHNEGFAANPVSGCIEVAGAQPGDMLGIHVLDIQLASLGYTGWLACESPFPDWIRQRGWGTVSKTVRIEDGFILWGKDLKIPVHPMVGIMATAPAKGCPSTVDLGPYGGNMDCLLYTSTRIVTGLCLLISSYNTSVFCLFMPYSPSFK